MEPSRIFPGRHFTSSSLSSIEIMSANSWNNSNYNASGVSESQNDANQMALNPIVHKRIDLTPSECNVSHNSNVLPFARIEPDPTSHTLTYPKQNNLYPNNLYGSMPTSLSTCDIHAPYIGDKHHRMHHTEWHAPFSSTPVHEWLKNDTQMTATYAPCSSTSDSFSPNTTQQQQQQLPHQHKKQATNENSLFQYDFSTGATQEQSIKDQSFQLLEDIFMDQSLKTPDMSREDISAEQEAYASSLPLLNTDSIGYPIQDGGSLASRNFKYNTPALPAELSRLDVGGNNNDNNESSYNSYYTHTGDSTGNTDMTEPIVISTTGTGVMNFYSSLDTPCDTAGSIMHHTAPFATPLSFSSTRPFSCEDQILNTYPSRICTQTCDRCSQSSRQACEPNVSYPQTQTAQMPCGCAHPGFHPTEHPAGYPSTTTEPICHPLNEVTKHYGQIDSAIYQEKFAQLLTSRTNAINENFNVPDGDAQLFSCSHVQTQSASTYFWQYNAQCKGPKAIRLIEFDNTTMRSDQISEEQGDLGGSLESSYFGSSEPLTSSCAESYSIEEKYLKLPKLLASSSISPYSLPNYPLVIFEDPVQRRYDLVHCSKLRRGDGNDVTPNLARLRSMGEELEFLNEQLLEHGEIIVSGAMSPQPTTGTSSMVVLSPTDKLMKRSSTTNCADVTIAAAEAMLSGCKLVEQAKREKNKLASKICRLKKKAFHEANKIKYTGLELEYSELATVIIHVKRLISEHLQRTNQPIVNNAAKSPHNPSAGQHQQNQQQSDQDASEYVVSSTTGMDDYHLNRRCVNHQAGVKAVLQKRDNPLEACTVHPMYCSTPRSTYSLFEQASHMYSSLHVTHAAGRTDALVEEVLRMARDGLTTHPLIKQMAVEGVVGQLSPTTTSRAYSSYGINTLSSCVHTGTEARVISHIPTQSFRMQPQLATQHSPNSNLSNNYAPINPPPKFVVPYSPTNERSFRSNMLHY